ncbi:hypothetical protein Neosp_009695 [[Neocosmospora] mangrovei]
MERSLSATSTGTDRSVDHMPSLVLQRDLRPLIQCGSSVLEKDALMRKLWDLLPGSFMIPTHRTTNRPIDGQLTLDSHYYISSDEFLNMTYSGEIATYGTYGDQSRGVSRQTIAAASATGRIVVMDVDMRSVEQLEAIPRFDARYVFITPPSLAVFEPRLSTESTGIYEPLR